MAAKRKNYFSDNIQRNGENFLQQFDAKKLRNDARRIVMDIAFGNIDFDEYGIYFSDPQLINALIDVVYTKLVIHSTSFNGLDFMSKSVSSSDIENIKRYHRRLAEAYQLFYDYFTSIKASGYSGESIALLKVLSTRTREYSQDLVDPVFSNVNSGGMAAAYGNPAVNSIYNGYQQPARTVISDARSIQASQEPVAPDFTWLRSDEAKRTRIK